ncbi:ABC transporter ATP-binding protein [Streptomyces sp. NBC_00094]|uniref:ABC transporter ATP-binding protein n=1 Tax=Streptomyces sp. NBC_00094 TaxID=2903620 RepID=UPI002256E3A8|nr:ATP-binding cassette domain-containing protein [Streptomyces sp. NBC_00094]MCX5389068.1 ATP-binding cassette domain-containing protein [Streptomyces sp. NBC_00094]
MIEVENLTKRYGAKVAVDGLSFSVTPGKVTGFLGPNGAGKSTTLRMILGLDEPTAGRATVFGVPYRSLARPLTRVGALLDTRAVHPGRSARNHLRVLAASHGLPATRADEVLDRVGLLAVARQRVRGFSLGMGQRLGVAAALLGDPEVLLFDEPVNGLDPEGVRWIRDLMRGLAGEGRTVLVSSHLMNEMAVTADHLVVVARGRLLADTPVDAFIAAHSDRTVLARVADPEGMRRALREQGIESVRQDDATLAVSGASVEKVGLVASAENIAVFELTASAGSLEEAFMKLTQEHAEYRASTGGF